METGYIEIKENANGQFIIKGELVNGNLWLTKYEMARLFNVYVNTIENNLRSIFKSGILWEEKVTCIIKPDCSDTPKKWSEMKYYNIEILIIISCRIASFESNAFRRWVINALDNYVVKSKISLNMSLN